MDEKYKRAVFPPLRVSQSKTLEDKEMKKRARAALREAHKIRQFEIDLYWRRSLYFWGFQAGFFAAYSLIFNPLSKLEDESKSLAYIAMLIVACLGLAVSILWHFLEKGSKAWQENWENHIDQLEDEFTGRLYKIVLGKEKDFYSVTKINQKIIFFIGFAWLWLAALPLSLLRCEKNFLSFDFWCCFTLIFGCLSLGVLSVFCLFKVDRITCFRVKSSFPSEKEHRVNEPASDNDENGIGAKGEINIYYRWKKEDSPQRKRGLIHWLKRRFCFCWIVMALLLFLLFRRFF